jgi:NitT/TauT family transport system permease protein
MLLWMSRPLAGIALGRIRILADVFAPYIKLANPIPRIALGSLSDVAFGLGLTSQVLLVVAGAAKTSPMW